MNKNRLMTRAALGDPQLTMQLDVGDVGFRIEKIAVDCGAVKIYLRNGSIFTARCAEIMGVTVHIAEKNGTSMKLKIVGGDLTEVE